jgi:putative transposase
LLVVSWFRGGLVVNALVQARRDKRAATKLMRKLLKKQGVSPQSVVTDKLRSYRVALRDLGLAARQVTGGHSNNRAENSHQPVRRRERSWIGFKRAGPTQRYLSAHAAVYNCFNIQRHLITRRTLKAFRDAAFADWRMAIEAA